MANGTSSSGKPSMNMTQLASRPPAGALDLGLRLQDLAAFVHAGLEVDVVGTPQFARILVLDIGRPLERIGGAAHATARRRGFSFRHSHGTKLLKTRKCRFEAGLIEEG